METTLGIIEGFYGKPYLPQSRKTLISLLSKKDYSYYIYAPKNDDSLRKNWKRSFNKDELLFLKDIKKHCQKHHLQFGVGLSPLKITEDLDNLLPCLQEKIDCLIDELQIDILAILFDDIKLYSQKEGYLQNLIVRTIYQSILKKKKAIRLIFCPTYYSFDPILEKIFGARPDSYFEDITKDLDESIEIFWTGNKVVSKEITKEDIQKTNSLFKRKVTLWDNYPVNDGKNLCDKLFTKPFYNRDNLDGIVKSHAINPMCECLLSYIAAATLYLLYKHQPLIQIEKARLDAIDELFEGKSALLVKYFDSLNDEGKSKLEDTKKADLLKILSSIDTIARREVVAYLNDYFKFDPSCLT